MTTAAGDALHACALLMDEVWASDSALRAKEFANCVAVDAVAGGDVRDAGGLVRRVDVAIADAEAAGDVAVEDVLVDPANERILA
jgi:hypothetical protein